MALFPWGFRVGPWNRAHPHATPGYAGPMEPAGDGYTEDFERMYDRYLGQEREAVGPPPDPAAIPPAEPSEPEIVNVRDLEQLPRGVLERMIAQKRGMTPRQRRKAGRVYEATDDGTTYRVDEYRHAKAMGIPVLPRAPRAVNALIGALSTPQTRQEMRQARGQQFREQATMDRARRAEERFEAEQDWRRTQAGWRREDLHRQHEARMREAELRALERTERAMREARRDELDPLEQLEYDFWKENPELYGFMRLSKAGLMEEGAGGVGGGRGGAADVKPPTLDQARKALPEIQRLMLEIDDAIEPLETEAEHNYVGPFSGRSGWLFNIRENEPVEIQISDRVYTVPAGMSGQYLRQLQQQRAMYARLADRLNTYLETGQWPGGAESVVGIYTDPYRHFEEQYERMSRPGGSPSSSPPSVLDTPAGDRVLRESGRPEPPAIPHNVPMPEDWSTLSPVQYDFYTFLENNPTATVEEAKMYARRRQEERARAGRATGTARPLTGTE